MIKRQRKFIQRTRIKRRPPKPVSKERKKTKLQQNKDNPYSRYWRDKCEPIWRAIVLYRAGNKSKISACTHNLQVHHLIHRSRSMTRWDLNNGFVLTAYEHKFMVGGPHGPDAWMFAELLAKRYPEKLKWMKQHANDSGRMCWHDIHGQLTRTAYKEKICIQ